MNLSPNFSYDELVCTSHRTIPNVPTPDIVQRLAVLCQTLLEPIRAQFGPLHVDSGYRCPALNAAVGGVADSAHVFGCAADVVPLEAGISVGDMMTWVASSGLKFDQVIDENSPSGARWLHVGALVPPRPYPPRAELLVMRSGRYSPWSAAT